MDNQLTPCPEPKRRAESGELTVENHPSQANGRVIHSLNFTGLNDLFTPDELSFQEDECFVLSETYVLMEEEYVMWNEDYTPRNNKKTMNGNHSLDEEVLSFPLEESN